MLSDNKNIILNSNYDEVKVKVLMGRNISIKNVEKGIKIVRKLIMK